MTTTAEAHTGVAGGAPAPPRPSPMPAPAGIGAAAAGGVAMLFAFPPYDAWWLAPVAVALLALAVHRRRPLAGAGLGALTGLIFFAPLLSWTNLEVGNVPWLLLVALQASYFALQGAAAAYLTPVAERWRGSWPLLTALLWVGQEALRSTFPFGGFPWGRLAFSQGDSPLLRLAASGGAPLVTFAVALAGGLLAAGVLVLAGGAGRSGAPTAAGRSGWRRRWAPGRSAVALVAAAVVVVLAGLAMPLRTPNGPTVTVAIVQGNVPRLGFDFNAQRRAVLDNHVNATIVLAADVDAGRRPRPDLVVWPENSSDIDPLRNADAAAGIDRAATAIAAPILVGAVLRGPGENHVRNAGLVWRPGGGPGQTYIKRHPVPFAEYVPLRGIVRKVYRDIDMLVPRDFVAGDVPGVLTVGPAVVGDVICFEVAYDGLVRDTVTDGAQLLATQTNNATFNVAEARQQLAMVRLRAVEYGRHALMASTVGVSGFIGADGTVSDASRFFTQDVLVGTLSLSEARTVAAIVGPWPEFVLVGGLAAALAVAALLRLRQPAPRRRGASQGGGADHPTASRRTVDA